MDEPPRAHDRLLDALVAIGFDRRYYAYLADHPAGTVGVPEAELLDLLRAVLAESGLSFSSEAPDPAFSHERRTDGGLSRVTAAVLYSELELILGVWLPNGATFGGPYPQLALLAAQRRDPTFEPKPAYPRIPFADRAALAEAVRFGLDLFTDASDAICRALQADAWRWPPSAP